MASCPQCGTRLSAAQVTRATGAAGIECPNCKSRLQVNPKSRMLWTLIPFAAAFLTYATLLIAGADRGVAFFSGLLVAVVGGPILLARYARVRVLEPGVTGKSGTGS